MQRRGLRLVLPSLAALAAQRVSDDAEPAGTVTVPENVCLSAATVSLGQAQEGTCDRPEEDGVALGRVPLSSHEGPNDAGPAGQGVDVARWQQHLRREVRLYRRLTPSIPVPSRSKGSARARCCDLLGVLCFCLEGLGRLDENVHVLRVFHVQGGGAAEAHQLDARPPLGNEAVDAGKLPQRNDLPELEARCSCGYGDRVVEQVQGDRLLLSLLRIVLVALEAHHEAPLWQVQVHIAEELRLQLQKLEARLCRLHSRVDVQRLRLHRVACAFKSAHGRRARGGTASDALQGIEDLGVLPVARHGQLKVLLKRQRRRERCLVQVRAQRTADAGEALHRFRVARAEVCVQLQERCEGLEAIRNLEQPLFVGLTALRGVSGRGDALPEVHVRVPDLLDEGQGYHDARDLQQPPLEGFVSALHWRNEGVHELLHAVDVGIFFC